MKNIISDLQTIADKLDLSDIHELKRVVDEFKEGF